MVIRKYNIYGLMFTDGGKTVDADFEKQIM
jgi:hypothetical protein